MASFLVSLSNNVKFLQISVHSPVLYELDLMISHNPANIKESAKMVVKLRTIWVI